MKIDRCQEVWIRDGKIDFNIDVAKDFDGVDEGLAGFRGWNLHDFGFRI